MRVVHAGAALAVAGQQDLVWGHVAIRDPQGRGAWLKAAGWGFDEVSPDRVVLVDWAGEVIEGAGRPHIESHIHLGVFRARSDVDASVHTHSAEVNAFSALDVPMRAISHDGVLFTDPQVPRSPLPADLISSSALGDALAVALGAGRACLMPRHGLVAVGTDEAEAVMHAVLLASACAVMLQAMAAGNVRSWSDPDEVYAKRAHVWPRSQLVAGYDHLVRLAADRRR
ncbi:MAG: class II aldolase/adducin family protein [Nakamurella sp.]